MIGTLLGGGAIIAILTACWEHIKGLFSYLKGYVVCTIWIDSHDEQALMRYLQSKNAKFVNTNNILYENYYVIRGSTKTQIEGEILNNGYKICHFNKKVLLINFKRNYLVDDFKMKNYTSITFPRLMFNPDKLYKDIISFQKSFYDLPKLYITHVYGSTFSKNSYSTNKSDQPYFEKSNITYLDDEYHFQNHRLLSNIDMLPPNKNNIQVLQNMFLESHHEQILNETKHWLSQQSWYEDRCVPWRRGYLLHGSPGTGKTAFIRALSIELDLPIIIPDLGSFNNKEIRYMWSEVIEHRKPCIVLIEDIDNVFDGRKNISESTLSFDVFLNCLDGIEDNSGILCFITTNNIDKVDPALGGGSEEVKNTRPGRIDQTIEFGHLSQNGKRALASNILSGIPYDHLIDSKKETVAQFQERCIAEALNFKQKEFGKVYDKI